MYLLEKYQNQSCFSDINVLFPSDRETPLQNLRGEGLRTSAVCGLQACEYLNDPPLIYIGNKMSCLKMKKLERPEPPRKKNVTW